MQNPGERLRTLRDQRGLTQQELADRAGMDRSAVARIEIGDRRMTGTEVIYLADSLDTQPVDLVGAGDSRSFNRGIGDIEAPDARAMSQWFDEYVEDALFLDRTAARYGVE